MPLFELREVSKAYGRQVVLRGASLDMKTPEVLGLIGPNGAGKTTLLRTLLGLVRASGGQVFIDGVEPLAVTRRLRVSYFGGEATLPPRVSERRWRRLLGLPASAAAGGRAFRVLSRGSRQMAGLRGVFDRTGSKLLVLDEPYEGLDPDGGRWLSSSLRAAREAGTGCLLSSHRLHDLAGACDRYAFFVEGALVARTANEIGHGVPVTGDMLVAEFDRLRERS